jgi:hypothetical protein
LVALGRLFDEKTYMKTTSKSPSFSSMKKSLLLPFILLTLIAYTQPRTIVTTDGEVDDQDSFIRLLLYSNEFKLEGLVYSSSQWHYKGDGKGTKYTSSMSMTKDRYGERTELRWPGTTWMQEFIQKYAMVYPNLIKHDKNFPKPEYLNSIIKTGNIDFEGEMEKDTEGSDLIKKILLDNNSDPVYLQIWGGTNTVARALKSIEDQYKSTSQWGQISKKVSDKAIIYAVLDQDNTYKKYIEPNWPNIRILYNANQFWNFAYPWTRVVPPPVQPYLRGPWFKENIKFNHGPLLESYYLWGDGTRIQNDEEHNQGVDTATMKKYNMTRYDFISEGDSPAFLHLVNVGLGNLGDASYGGWGGRMVQSKTAPNRWEDGENVTDYNPYTDKFDRAYPQTRWIEAIQNDFAARADWCVKDFRSANHAPKVTVKANSLKAKKGATVKLTASVKDPDGNKVALKWWQYFEVDTYEGKITITDGSFVVPTDAKAGDTIHIIVEAIDDGTPNLRGYQRILVVVE